MTETYDDAQSVNQVPSTEETAARARDRGRDRPRVTFMGNSYDLASLGALATGVVLLLMCLTCNQAAYCLPCVPLILGIIGLAMAKDAVDAERTRLWSWIGIGSTGVIAALIGLAIVGYAFFIAVVVFMSEMNY
jgi:hypothetical protein